MIKKIIILILLGVSYVIGQIGYTQTGLASYYSDKFHGRRTASGEIFDKNKLTAAHRELPFGTLVKVTNLRNNKSVIVRINDRGPWKSTRIIDLSYAAAKKIDMIAAGEVPVKIEVVKPAPEYEQHTNKIKKKTHTKPKPSNKHKSEPTTKPFWGYGIFNKEGKKVSDLNGLYGIQVGSFKNLENAKELMQRINKKGFTRVYVKIQWQRGRKMYKVIVGKFATRDLARKHLPELKRKGFNGFPVKY